MILRKKVSLGNTQPQQLQLQHPLQPPEQLQKQLDVPQNNGTIIVPIQQNQDLQKRVKIVHQEPSQQIHVQQQVLPPINQQQVIIKQQQTTPTIKVPLSPAPQVQQSHISYADQPASSNFALALVPPPQLSAQQRYDDLFKHACNDGLYYSRQIASIRIQNRQHFSLENMKKVQERSQLHQNHNSFLHSNYQPGLTFLNYSNTLSAQILQKQTNAYILNFIIPITPMLNLAWVEAYLTEDLQLRHRFNIKIQTFSIITVP